MTTPIKVEQVDELTAARLELARARQRYYLWHTKKNADLFDKAARAHRAIRSRMETNNGR